MIAHSRQRSDYWTMGNLRGNRWDCPGSVATPARSSLSYFNSVSRRPLTISAASFISVTAMSMVKFAKILHTP